MVKKRQEFAFSVGKKFNNTFNHCIFINDLTQIIGDWSMLKPCGHFPQKINI